MPNIEAIRCIPARVVLAILCATGVMELYISRINLSIAIVGMVQTISSEDGSSNSTVIEEPYCLRDMPTFSMPNTSFSTITEDEFLLVNLTNDDSQEQPDDSRIQMTSLQRGNILSAFFYAYGLSGPFGGRLAEIYGTKKVFGTAVLVDALGNFLIPMAAKYSYGLFFFIRFAMGIFQGCCYPSLHAAASKWIPPQEQASFVSFVYPANSFGTIFTFSVYGIIISKWGWEASFYVSGAISLLWLVFWVFLVHDSPAQHPRISEEEKAYIQNSKADAKTLQPRKIPVKKMMLSIPLWALNVVSAGFALGHSFILTQLPIYMNSILGVNIRNNGFLSSLPFLARYFFGNGFTIVSNFVMKKTNMQKKTMKRILTIFAFGGPGVCMMLVGYVGCSVAATTALFVTGMALNGANFAGSGCNHLDLTVNYSGTALGFSLTVGYLYAMIGPVLVGALTPEETQEEWRIVYWLVFANYVIAGTFYCLFLSTERQSWDFDMEDAEQAENLNIEKNSEENDDIQERSQTK